MKKTLRSVWIAALAAITAIAAGRPVNRPLANEGAIATGFEANRPVQNFEGAALGGYQTLSYTSEGVDVTITAAGGGWFNIIDNGLYGLLGRHSLITSGGSRGAVRIEFSEPVHGFTAAVLTECIGKNRYAWVSCFDADDNLLHTFVGDRDRPCNQFVSGGLSILNAELIAYCEAVGMIDNLIVEP